MYVNLIHHFYSFNYFFKSILYLIFKIKIYYYQLIAHNFIFVIIFFLIYFLDYNLIYFIP